MMLVSVAMETRQSTPTQLCTKQEARKRQQRGLQWGLTSSVPTVALMRDQGGRGSTRGDKYLSTVSSWVPGGQQQLQAHRKDVWPHPCAGASGTEYHEASTTYRQGGGKGHSSGARRDPLHRA